jgi:hypothetical protein
VTSLYPRERVEAVLRPLALASAHRIILRPRLAAPLAVHPSKSRFCDGRTCAVLYGANDFATAFIEVVVHDRFVQSDRRVVPFGDIAARVWVGRSCLLIVLENAVNTQLAVRSSPPSERFFRAI